jgi:hypothetical protein
MQTYLEGIEANLNGVAAVDPPARPKQGAIHGKPVDP